MLDLDALLQLSKVVIHGITDLKKGSGRRRARTPYCRPIRSVTSGTHTSADIRDSRLQDYCSTLMRLMIRLCTPVSNETDTCRPSTTVRRRLGLGDQLNSNQAPLWLPTEKPTSLFGTPQRTQTIRGIIVMSVPLNALLRICRWSLNDLFQQRHVSRRRHAHCYMGYVTRWSGQHRKNNHSTHDRPRPSCRQYKCCVGWRCNPMDSSQRCPLPLQCNKTMAEQMVSCERDGMRRYLA